MWRWHGSTSRAAFSRRSGRARSSRMTSICSGSPRCSAITRCMGRCYAAIAGLSTSCLGRVPTPSPGSRRGFGPRTGPCPRCAPMGRWPGNSSRSPAHAAAWPAATLAAIEAFVATLTGYQVKTVEQKLCALRSFLKFASAEGLVDAAVVGRRPGGALEQAGQGPIGVGARRGGKDPARRSTGATRAGSGTTRSFC